jgi:hypothetical protein
VTDLLSQARVAARHGVRLGTVLRRYDIGFNQLRDVIAGEAERNGGYLQGRGLRELLRELTFTLERVLRELDYEYSREPENPPLSSDARLVNLVKRRLAGEPVAVPTYDFNARHIGVVIDGDEATQVLRAIAREVDGSLLRVRPDGGAVWAWIGSRRRADPADFEVLTSLGSRAGRIAFGEPGEGVTGWTRTHHQAREAFAYLMRDQLAVGRYADIAVRAAIERHDLSATSLRQLYVVPLEEQRDGGVVLLKTLRAYFSAGRNAAAAAAALGVKRQTISSRLRSIEVLLGRPLSACSTDLEIALRL